MSSQQRLYNPGLMLVKANATQQLCQIMHEFNARPRLVLNSSE